MIRIKEEIWKFFERKEQAIRLLMRKATG